MLKLTFLTIFLVAGSLLALGTRAGDTNINLNAWYDGYNQMYFQKELPEAGSFSPPDVIIDFHLDDPDKMGLTVFGEQDGFIRMGLNPTYIKSTKTLRLTMLHEMCHIRLFVEDIHSMNDHGPQWQSCMLDLAKAGAFADLW